MGRQEPRQRLWPQHRGQPLALFHQQHRPKNLVAEEFRFALAGLGQTEASFLLTPVYLAQKA
jgi:hypothetical protein